MGDVEPDHRHVDARVEDALRGLRVGPDVELGGRRDVALGDRAAHQHDPRRSRRMPRRAASATFVSGPAATSTRLRRRRARRGSRPRAASTGAVAARGSVGAVEPALAVDVRGDVQLAHERAVGAARRPARRSRPGELEHAQRVLGRLLERLVAGDGRDADELDLGLASASRSAIASSWPGSQSRTIGVLIARVSRRPPPRSAASLRAEARRGERAGGAGAAQRLLARRGPRAARRRRQAVNASPAAVPSTASTVGGSARATSSPSSSSTRALGAERDRDEPVAAPSTSSS